MGRLLPILLCFTPAACLLDFDRAGPQGGTAGSGATQGAGGGGGEPAGGGGGEAPCDGECISLPDGFSSVVRLTTDECEAVAEGGLDDVAVSAPEAVCACSCVVPDDLCRSVRPASDTTCTVNGSAILAAPGPACTTLTAPAKGLGFVIGGQPTATCDSDEKKADKPPFTLNETTRACPVEASCGGADLSCLPAGAGTYCLLADTATECPAELVPHQLNPLSSYFDDRDCECACNGVDGNVGCGTPTVVFYESTDCSGQGFSGFTAVNCATPTSFSFSSFVFTRSVSGSCAPATHVTSGGVAPPKSGLLLCCRA